MISVTLVEQYFYPDGWGGAEIPRDIAIAMKRAGIDVSVLCGAEQYAPTPSGVVAQDPRSSGLAIQRIPRIIPGSVRRLRMLRLLWFCLCAACALTLRRRIDLIMTQTNPPLIVPVVALVAAVRRIPFLIVAQDVYPEVLFAAGVARPNTLVGGCLARLFSWAYARASRVVVLGSFMQRRIRAKGVSPERIVTISNWATGELGRQYGENNALRLKWGLHNRFVVLYSGNIGVGHEFDTFLRGVGIAARTHAQLAAVFIGRGARLPEVRTLTRALGLEDRVVFQDFVAADALPLSMGVADLALVTMRPGFEGVIVPSKLLGYMARGIPILYVGPDSDIAEMIVAAGCGVCCDTGCADRVADVLSDAINKPDQLLCWSRSGQAFYAKHLSRDIALNRYVDLARDAVAASRRT